MSLTEEEHKALLTMVMRSERKLEMRLAMAELVIAAAMDMETHCKGDPLECTCGYGKLFESIRAYDAAVKGSK